MSSEEQARRVWSLGSYPDIATNFLPMAARLVEAVGVAPDESVLDVGCGTGNVAVTAARRGARVTGLDLTPSMLVGARENAAIAGVEEIDWREGNATDLPFDDDAFDVTLSCVGHVFADPPDVTTRELLRVTRPGGRIAFTSWTPASVVPAMGAVLKEYLAPNPGAPDPHFLWGDADVVRERFGDGVDDLEFDTEKVWYPALSPAHYWKGATVESGLFIAALEEIDESERPALRDEMIETIDRYFDDRKNAVPMEYRLTRTTVE